jgi:hypothetical protein
MDLIQQTESLLIVLATRVQMGCTAFSVVSNLASKGVRKNLTGVTGIPICPIQFVLACHVYDG